MLIWRISNWRFKIYKPPAINLNPEYQETAKTDAGFDVIRENEEFKRLVMGNGE